MWWWYSPLNIYLFTKRGVCTQKLKLIFNCFNFNWIIIHSVIRWLPSWYFLMKSLIKWKLFSKRLNPTSNSQVLVALQTWKQNHVILCCCTWYWYSFQLMRVGNTVLKIFEPFKIYPGRNITTVQTPGGHHDISGHKAAGCWLGISPLGFIGTLVNSFVLLMFVQERDTLFTGVNIMIW